MTWVVIALVALSGPVLLFIGHRVVTGTSLRHRFAYQGLALSYAVLLWLTIMLLVPDHGDLGVIGDLSAPVDGLQWLGVSADEHWSTLLLTIGTIVVLVTATTMWFQVGRPARLRWRAWLMSLPVAVVLAILNATNEELIFRVTLIEGTAPAVAVGTLTAGAVALISAVAFGLPHWFGHPRGPLGALLAAFLGWLAAMATLQTGGIAWAWTLHAILDVVILSIVLGAQRTSDPRGTVAG